MQQRQKIFFDARPELKDIVLVLKDANITEWYNLGLQLGLPAALLDTITAHPDIEDHGRMMLSKWLETDPDASWEKLAAAMTTIGQKATATTIRRQFVKVTDEQHERTLSGAVSTHSPKPKPKHLGGEQILLV